VLFIDPPRGEVGLSEGPPSVYGREF